MAWQACKWERMYGKALIGSVEQVRARFGESTVYGPRFRWTVVLAQAATEIASGHADSVEAASAAADAWITQLVDTALPEGT